MITLDKTPRELDSCAICGTPAFADDLYDHVCEWCEWN